MSKVMQAVVDFADLKKGQLFHAYQVPLHPIDQFKNVAGRWYYFYKPAEDDMVLIEDSLAKDAIFTVAEALQEKVVYEDKGVQDFEDFCQELEVNDYDFDWNRYSEFKNGTKLEFFERWYCTDTWVGYGVLSIAQERVALFHQSGRKMDCNYKWLSVEAKRKTRSFLMEFIKQDDSYEKRNVVSEDDNVANFFW